MGTDPGTTQKRVQDEFVTATTASCTEATHESAPWSHAGRKRTRVDCRRRRLRQVDRALVVQGAALQGLHRRARGSSRSPTISSSICRSRLTPSCKDVPCDAFSTCRTGKCFIPTRPPTATRFLEPGDPGDGGTSADGDVIPDTGVDYRQPRRGWRHRRPDRRIGRGRRRDSSEGGHRRWFGARLLRCERQPPVPVPHAVQLGVRLLRAFGRAAARRATSARPRARVLTQYCCMNAPCPVKPCTPRHAIVAPVFPWRRARTARCRGARRPPHLPALTRPLYASPRER